MKVKVIMLCFCYVFFLYSPFLFSETGGAGSEVEERSVLLDLELRNSQGIWVKLYTGSKYLEVIGSSPGSIAGSVDITKPNSGTYTHYRMTLRGERIKAKINIGGTVYYTTEETKKRNEQNSQNAENFTMSTNLNDYGSVTVDDLNHQSEVELTPSLEVSSGNDLNMVWILRADEGVNYESFTGGGATANNINFISRPNELKAVVFEIPHRLIQIPIVFKKSGETDLTNTAGIIVDRSGKLIGGDCVRPDKKAINCSFFVSGNFINMSGNGASATFSIVYRDGDGNGQYTVSGSYDCNGNSFSNLAIEGTGTVSNNYDSSYTLQTSGDLTCQTVQ